MLSICVSAHMAIYVLVIIKCCGIAVPFSIKHIQHVYLLPHPTLYHSTPILGVLDGFRVNLQLLPEIDDSIPRDLPW